MSEVKESIINVGVLLPFDYNLYQVSIILDVFTKVNQLSNDIGSETRFDISMMQTQGQINAYSDTFFHFPVVNTFYEKSFDYVFIPPFNDEDIQEVIDKNKVFREWILQQTDSGAHVVTIGNGMILAAYSGLLKEKTIQLTNVSRSFFEYFNLKKGKSSENIQHFEHLTLSNGSIQIFHLMISILKKYFKKEFYVEIAKHYQVDVSTQDYRYFEDFEWVYESNDSMIDSILDKIHHSYHKIQTIEELLTDYPESRRNFNRKFLEHVKMTPIEYLQNIRISVAKRILETTDTPLDQIPSLVGYQDLKSFRFIFHRITGLLPSEYRKKWTF